MVDREKVIRGLHCCSHTDGVYCIDCPYDNKDTDCVALMSMDVLELLKEQEAVKPKSKVRHGANAQIQHFCGNCNSMLHGKPKHCPECGKGVLW